FKTSQPQLATGHARAGAKLFAQRGEAGNVEKLVARICSVGRCSDDDLRQLKSLVEVSGNWSLLAKALQKQADGEPDKARRFALLEQLGLVYWRKMKDFARARLTYVLAMKSAPAPHRVKLALA